MKPDLCEISEEESKFITSSFRPNITRANTIKYTNENQEDLLIKVSQETKNSLSPYQTSGYKFPSNINLQKMSNNPDDIIEFHK